jgi:hypothetical protein
MSYIQVGVNENVKLKGADINEKGTLTISFIQDGAVATVSDLLNDAAGVKPNDGTTTIMLFPPSPEYAGEKRTVEQIAQDLGGFRDQLQHLLQGYVTSEAATLDPYAGLDTSNTESFLASLQTENVIGRIYKNLASQFIAKLKEIGSRLDTDTFRLLLVRRSAASHYGTFRKRFVTSNPFWESMSIPAASSKLKFTKYEISKGLNDGTPVAADAVQTSEPAESNAAADILGSR